MWTAVLEFLPSPYALAAVNRTLRFVVQRNVLHWRETTTATTTSTDDDWQMARRPLWVSLEAASFDRTPDWIATTAVGPATTLDVRIAGWHEWRSIVRLVSATQPRLRRIALRAPRASSSSMSSASNGALGATTVSVLSQPGLRSFALHASNAGLRDVFANDMRRALASAMSLTECFIDLSLNDLTLRGLVELVSGLIAAPVLQDLTLDLSGNWMRGIGYGEVVARLQAAAGLQRLDLRVGGWGMRKQYGLEHLGDLGRLPALAHLAIAIRGAQVTQDSFRKAMLGIATAPRLRSLSLDFATHSTVGASCYRALVALRQCNSLQRIAIRLAAPEARFLQGLRSIGNTGTLECLDLHLCQPRMQFTAEHADAVLGLLPLRIALTVSEARFDDTAWDRLHAAAAAPGSRLTINLQRSPDLSSTVAESVLPILVGRRRPPA